MTKNLITGGLGFIGFHLTNLLLEKGEEVTIFDVAPGSKLFRNMMDKVTLIRGDISNWSHVLDAVRTSEADCIYHMGAMLPPGSEQNPQGAFNVNVNGTYNVLEAARMFNVGSVMFISTLATYGRDVPSVVPNNAAQHPVNMYGVTKVCGERLGEYYQKRFDVNFRAVRLTPILGMGRVDSAQSAYLYKSVQEAAIGRPYSIYVNPDTSIAVLYVKDAAWGLYDLKCASEESLTTRVYNLYGLTVTGQELSDAIAKAVPTSKIDFKPDEKQIQLVGNLPARLDDAMARNDWGWAPRFTLVDAVADFVKDIRNNADIYS
jgi:nucleoside-diphosphate-sugar epimerase